MELLKELIDSDYNEKSVNFEYREAVRIVAIDEHKNIPILFVSKYNYHKLPWGWIDKWEDKYQALRREMLEETGCDIKVEWEIGMINEFRSDIKFNWINHLKQVSYCYYWNIINKDKWLFLTQDELNDWFELKWLIIDDAIITMEKDNPSNFEWTFILERDLTFLKKYKDILN